MTRRLALLLGPIAFAVTVLAPTPLGLSGPAWRVAGLATWMATWWLSAVVPLPATALLPLVTLPIVGVSGIGDIAARYADPIIFLFLGGFLIAATMERWELHRRFALATLRVVGTEPRRIILGFLLFSAFASMWISNTATAVMMLPIAMAVGGKAGGREGGKAETGFATALFLAVAYGASIGGVATLIGTPPNAILAATAQELISEEITFASWLPIGLSVAVPMLIGCWFVLVKMFDVKAEGDVAELPPALPPSRHSALQYGDRFVFIVFVLTALAWIMRTPKVMGSIRIPGLADLIPGLTDAGIAVGAAVVLLTVPVVRSRYRVALDWETARGIPWGILLLFGGGLALAGAFEASGLSAWVGGQLSGFAGVPLPVVVALTATLFVALTELTSNTATAALGMPLLAGVAGGLGVPALPLMVAGALASSMAFMLPVATPPNAIVFGSGAVRPAEMARAGTVLNGMAVVVITLVVWIWYG